MLPSDNMHEKYKQLISGPHSFSLSLFLVYIYTHTPTFLSTPKYGDCHKSAKFICCTSLAPSLDRLSCPTVCRADFPSHPVPRRAFFCLPLYRPTCSNNCKNQPCLWRLWHSGIFRFLSCFYSSSSYQHGTTALRLRPGHTLKGFCMLLLFKRKTTIKKPDRNFRGFWLSRVGL